MKKIILILCTILICANNTQAQVVISSSDLIGTKWQTAKQYDDQSKVYYEYTQEKRIKHKSNGNSFASPYYLSNTIPTQFDYTKVGIITKGCYYVEINPKSGTIYCCSIKQFNKVDGTMTLKYVDGDDITYIMIPSNKPRKQSEGESVLDESIW